MESSDAGRGGWKSKPIQPQKNKMNMNILRQEKLIAQKKKEIEAKMAEQAKINVQATSKPIPPSSPTLQGPSSNKFVNDGSFLQQFMKMQKEKSNSVSGSTSDTKTPSTSSPGGNSLQKKSILVGKRPGLGVSSMLSQFKSYSQSKKNPVLSQRPSVFCSPDDEDEEEEADYSRFLEMKVSPPEDSDTRLIIDKMASFVAEGGPELERKAKEDYKDNPVFSFLYDKSSLEYLYYKNRVANLKKDLLRPENTSDNGRILTHTILSTFPLCHLSSQKNKNVIAKGVGSMSIVKSPKSMYLTSNPSLTDTLDCVMYGYFNRLKVAVDRSNLSNTMFLSSRV